MKNKNDIIIATDSDGAEITILKANDWINKADKDKLSNLLYDRLYGRYIKPYMFNNNDFQKSYKNGFAIMTSCCLLIETYTSFVEPSFKDTHKNSERCFGWFFNENRSFYPFSIGGLSTAEYLATDKKITNKGLPRDFYINVRCGILHNGETRNGWIIRRDGALFEPITKTINATLFLELLHELIINHRVKLQSSDIKSPLWISYLNRLIDIMQKS